MPRKIDQFHPNQADLTKIQTQIERKMMIKDLTKIQTAVLEKTMIENLNHLDLQTGTASAQHAVAEIVETQRKERETTDTAKTECLEIEMIIEIAKTECRESVMTIEAAETSVLARIEILGTREKIGREVR